jgi:hypothetical protein
MRTFSANEFSIVVSVFSIDRRYSFSGIRVLGSEVQRLKSIGLLVSGSRSLRRAQSSRGLPYFGGFWLAATFRNPQSATTWICLLLINH